MNRPYYNSGTPFLCTGGEEPGSGMDCLPHRQSAGPFHYLINEQAKSLVALQELQHEVGALLEFRDLVIETFPNLRTKLAHSTPTTMTANSTQLSNIPIAVRRDWEPGVRVRRKLAAGNKDDTRPSSQKKSAETAVQDSGFSTEASSKETHSASSNAPQVPSSSGPADVEDELWNLLDVIHRKGTRLRDELDALQDALEDDRPKSPQPTFERALLHASVDDVRQLKRERDLLMERVAEMEAEVLAGRIHTSRLQDDLQHLLITKRDLEEQLRAVMTQSGEVNTRIHDLHTQFVTKVTNDHSTGAKLKCVVGDTNPSQRTRRRISVLDNLFDDTPKVRNPDTRKITAILQERDPLILQKHLLNSTVQNQVLQEQLIAAGKLEEGLVDQLGRAKEENEDLRFQLEDKNIDLEGTKARVRMLEQRHRSNVSTSPDIIPVEPTTDNTEHRSRSEIITASMKAMSPLPNNLLQLDHSSSTESAHDQAEVRRTEKRKSGSRIPLMKSYAAPKPPGGGKQQSSTRSRSGDSLGRPHSAQSIRKYNDSLKSSSSLSKSLHKESLSRGVSTPNQNGSRVQRKNSTITVGGGGGGGGGTVRRTASIRDSPEAKMKETKEKLKQERWMLSSYNSDSIEFYSDSLDMNESTQLFTIETSSNRYQTANTFIWNVSGMKTDFYDSMNSNMTSNLYQMNDGGEELAECDSLDKVKKDCEELAKKLD